MCWKKNINMPAWNGIGANFARILFILLFISIQLHKLSWQLRVDRCSFKYGIFFPLKNSQTDVMNRF